MHAEISHVCAGTGQPKVPLSLSHSASPRLLLFLYVFVSGTHELIGPPSANISLRDFLQEARSTIPFWRETDISKDITEAPFANLTPPEKAQLEARCRSVWIETEGLALIVIFTAATAFATTLKAGSITMAYWLISSSGNGPGFTAEVTTESYSTKQCWRMRLQLHETRPLLCSFPKEKRVRRQRKRRLLLPLPKKRQNRL